MSEVIQQEAEVFDSEAFDLDGKHKAFFGMKGV